MSSNSGGGIRFSNIGNSLNNTRVVRTDKYDNDPYRDKVVLHCPFHNNFNDISGYSRVHSVTGTPLIDSADYVRKGGSCDINSSSINYSSASWMNLNQDFTIECWVKQNSVPNNSNMLLSRWKLGSDLKNGSFTLRISSSNIVLTASSNGEDSNLIFTSDHNFLINRWYHVVCQRKNNIISFYIDGVKIGEHVITTSIVIGTQPLLIGRLVFTGIYDYRSDFNISDLRITLGVARYDGTFIPQ